MKFVIVHNIASPYRIHVFTQLHQLLATCGIEFHVHFMSDMSKGHAERPLSWRNPKLTFPHTYWRDYGIGSHHFNPGMIAHLLRYRPDILMVGSAFDTFTGIALACLSRAGVKATWTEGNTKTAGVMSGLKGFIKRFVFAQFKVVAVPGVEGVRYMDLLQRGTKRRMPKCLILPNLIDETCFRPRAAYSADAIERKRIEFGCGPNDRLCLIPARLEWYKGLVEFFSLLTPEMLSGWKIRVMGSGSQKKEILTCLQRRKLDDFVSIQELVPYDEMPTNYAAADLFLLPSLMDRNPLSVVEALHSGLPVAVSSYAGNVDEAVSEGENGWVLPVKSPVYADVLRRVFSTPLEKLREMGAVSFSHNAQFWNTKKSIGRFVDDILKIGAMSEN